jgi:hypothetical protein
MIRRLVLVAAGALILTAAAHAKGPSEAAISGPGLDEQITISGMGDMSNGSPLMTFADGAGFFPAVFRQSPDPTLRSRPAGDLGPRYTITYRVPGPNGSIDTIRQDLYPYANGGALTYTEPGQKIFRTEGTYGGWFRAGPALKTMLVDRGLPKTAPVAATDDGSGALDGRWPVAVGLVAFALVAAASLLVVRRRLRTAAP